MNVISRLGALLLIALVCNLSSSLFAQNGGMPDGVTKLASVEGITEYKIEANGLRILLFPDNSKPTVTVNVTYLVGSRHEAYGETGMAHLLEHLVFKGTPNHEDIPKELNERGARFNGTTWYDRTNYFETVSANDENLRWALEMESDRMVNSYISGDDLKSEMTVVRNEFEMGENSPTGILMERVLSTAYLWHNYGKSTIGARADLENVPIERLQGFYRKYYQPDNAYLIIAGKFDPAKTMTMIMETFGKIPAPDRELIPTYTREPIQDGERYADLKRVGDIQAVSAAYHIPPGSHQDYPAVDVLVELLTSEPSGRLYKALVESGKASSQWGWAAELAEPGFAYFNADVLKDKDLEAAKMAMLTTLDAVKDNPPSAEEVERAKNKLLKDFNLRMRESARVGTLISEYIAQGDWRLGFIYRDRLEQVSAEQVAEVSAKYLLPSNRTVGRFIPTEKPERAEIPDVPNISAMVDGYEGREMASEGEVFEATYENIDARTKTGEFKNSLEYAFLSKETRADAVQARLSLRYGSPASLKNKRMAATFAGMMLNKGTKSMTRQELEDKLVELKASVRIGGGAEGAYAIIETERDQLPAVIALVSEMMQEPSFPAEEFETLKQEELASLEQNRSEPQAIAITELNRRMSNYDKSDPRYTMTFDEEVAAINALTLDEVKAFYKEFYGATDATIAVVGDFEEEAIAQALEENFANWESPARYERLKDDFFQPEKQNVEFETPDKANAWFLAGQTMPISTSHPDYPAVLMGNYMLGGGALKSRLADRIRQQDGLSYGVGSFFNADDQDQTATLGGYAFFAPENVAAVEKAFFEEIEKVLASGYTDEELVAAKSGWMQKQQVTRAQDGSLAGALNQNLFLDRTMEWDADLEAKVMALSIEEINAAMQKYLDPEKMVVIKVGDFAKSRAVKP
ncbi:M16 family metallopeptidase [Lewinella sp. LCG006]|uniref:M16 family metallopeptidase n=1 Tax=Lewinella sp. LCG006 TaxID=3231911 RepID=UPI003460CC25